MLKIFSTGLGFAVGILSVIFVAITVITAKRKQKKSAAVFGVLTGICILYLVIGTCVLFRPPYGETEAIYLSADIAQSDIQTYFEKYASDIDANPVKNLNPNAETYNTKQIIYKDGSVCTLDFQGLSMPESRIEQVLYTCSDEDRAKTVYTEQKDNLKKEYAEKYLTQNNGYVEATSAGYSVCVFPLVYDGTGWLFPFADTDGTVLHILVRYGNQCLEIREISERGNLILPKKIFKEF